VGVEVDGRARLRRQHLLDQVGEAASGDVDVALGVAGAVVAGGDGPGVGPPGGRRPAAGVAEPHRRVGVVAELVEPQVVDRRPVAGRSEAGDRDRHPPLRRRGRAGRRWALAARARPQQPLAEVAGERQAAPGRVDPGQVVDAGSGRVVEPADGLVEPGKRQAQAGARQLGQGVRLDLGLRGAGGRLLQREELDVGDAGEQRGRVEVGVAPAGAEVERTAGRADDVALVDGLAEHHVDGGQEGVAGADAVGVGDRDVERAAHRAGEAHRAVRAGPHRGAGRGPVLEAAVAGAVGPGRWPERVDDRRVDWRDVGGRAGRRRRLRPGRPGGGAGRGCGHGEGHQGDCGSPRVAAARPERPACRGGGDDQRAYQVAG
jgi:hypothetical protein